MAAAVLDDRELQRIYSWVRAAPHPSPTSLSLALSHPQPGSRPSPPPPPTAAPPPQVDEIPLSRPKRSITRDFSDGVLMAELVHHYFPKLVESECPPRASAARRRCLRA